MRNTDKLGLVVPTNKSTENFSTQNYVDNFDKIDDFATATDSQLAENVSKTNKLSDMSGENKVLNSSFDNSKTSWTSTGPAGTGGGTTVEPIYNGRNNVLKITNVAGTRRETQVIPTIAGRKYYTKVMAYLESIVSGTPLFRSVNRIIPVDTSKIGQWQKLSAISTALTDSLTIYAGAESTSTFVVAFDDILIIDVTAIFGETTLTDDQIKDILDNYVNWFSGTESILLSLKDVVDLYAKEIKRIEQLTIVGFVDNPLQPEFTGQAMVTLSYDDGLMNQYDLALPLHEKHGIPATFNVISGRFASANFFSESVVKNCFNRGIEIASHCHTHDVPLTEKTDEQLHFEFSNSKTLLQNATGGTVETVAIPFSAYDARIKSIAQQYYKGVRVYGQTQNNIPPTDRYNIECAIAVGNLTTFIDVKAKIDEAIANKKWCVIMMHGIKNSTMLNTYEITQRLLDEILAYINSFDKSILLPINTRDALKYSLGASY